MSVRDEDLSRVVSHALRHEPEQYGLELDEHGWVALDHLLDALHTRGGEWTYVDSEAIARMIKSSTKKRHEIDGDRIRARYGHSTAEKIDRVVVGPPKVLYHSTSQRAWDQIRTSGLQPMNRQYVHLSTDPDLALLVGRRKSSDPVLLIVHAQRAAASGIGFRPVGDTIWLADPIPSAYIAERRS